MSRTYHHVPYKHQPNAINNSWRAGLWLRRAPKWWRKLHKHRKRRVELANALARLKKGADSENMTWPLDKKPWLYYY